MCKRKRCWYLLFRMEHGRAVHLYEPLRKYEVLSGYKERLSYKTPYGRFCDGSKAPTLRNKIPLFYPFIR